MTVYVIETSRVAPEAMRLIELLVSDLRSLFVSSALGFCRPYLRFSLLSSKKSVAAAAPSGGTTIA